MFAVTSELKAGGGVAVPAVLVNEPKSTPLLLSWLLSHTNGGAPANTPAPPLICKVLSLLASQLKPNLGLHSMLVEGALPVSILTPSLKVSASALALVMKFCSKIGMSALRPAVTIKCGVTANLSCAKKPNCKLFKLAYGNSPPLRAEYCNA